MQKLRRIFFSEPVPKLILDGMQNTTWRIDEDVQFRTRDTKNIALGETLSLCRQDGTQFAKARVLTVKKTTFGNLTAEDKAGREKFASEKEMLAKFSEYYKIKVTPETKLQIIKFKLV